MTLSEKALNLQTTFKVTTADTDMMARLRLGGLINYLVLSAIDSADMLGFGYGGLRSQHLFWVLSRMTVEICKPLRWYDKAIVETWPKDIDGLLYLRDFIVKNQEDEMIARCTSGWLAIDIQSKRPKKVQEDYSYIFNQMKEVHALRPSPEKLLPVHQGIPFDLKTSWFDLDVNKHVTSSRYIDWMMDTIPQDYLINHYPARLSINFLKETLYGDEIKLLQTSPQENIFLFEGRNSLNDISHFRGSIEFS